MRQEYRKYSSKNALPITAQLHDSRKNWFKCLRLCFWVGQQELESLEPSTLQYSNEPVLRPPPNFHEFNQISKMRQRFQVVLVFRNKTGHRVGFQSCFVRSKEGRVRGIVSATRYSIDIFFCLAMRKSKSGGLYANKMNGCFGSQAACQHHIGRLAEITGVKRPVVGRDYSAYPPGGLCQYGWTGQRVRHFPASNEKLHSYINRYINR